MRWVQTGEKGPHGTKDTISHLSSRHARFSDTELARSKHKVPRTQDTHTLYALSFIHSSWQGLFVTTNESKAKEFPPRRKILNVCSCSSRERGPATGAEDFSFFVSCSSLPCPVTWSLYDCHRTYHSLPQDTPKCPAQAQRRRHCGRGRKGKGSRINKCHLTRLLAHNYVISIMRAQAAFSLRVDLCTRRRR